MFICNRTASEMSLDRRQFFRPSVAPLTKSGEKRTVNGTGIVVELYRKAGKGAVRQNHHALAAVGIGRGLCSGKSIDGDIVARWSLLYHRRLDEALRRLGKPGSQPGKTATSMVAALRRRRATCSGTRKYPRTVCCTGVTY